jgi:hypothetical protein
MHMEIRYSQLYSPQIKRGEEQASRATGVKRVLSVVPAIVATPSREILKSMIQSKGAGKTLCNIITMAAMIVLEDSNMSGTRHGEDLEVQHPICPIRMKTLDRPRRYRFLRQVLMKT